MRLTRTAVAAALLVPLLLLPACASLTRDYYTHRFEAYEPRSTALPNPPFPPRALVMYAGSTGELLSWVDLLEGVRWADVIIVGETHDDATGHAVQAAIVEDAMNAWPGTVVSMEMLERDEQPLVDRYLAGEIDRELFLASAREGSWMRQAHWAEWYQPMIDTARDHGQPVIAANAPRRLVREVRVSGFTAVDGLPPEERVLIEVPTRRLRDGGYERRFAEVMGGGDATHGDEETVETFFRAQRTWDATMASSIAAALDDGAARVVHLVGQFHADFEGGLVQELSARAPLANILVISLQPVNALALRPEDVRRADVIIYTGVDAEGSTGGDTDPTGS